MWWVVTIIIATVVTLMACLRVAKESDERLYKQLHKPEKEGSIELLFSCAHIVVDVEVHSLKQLLKNQGYGCNVMEALDQDAKGIHTMIDANHHTATTSKLEAEFYLDNEQDYQHMLKALVGYLADINGYKEGQKLIDDWIQLHDDWIAKQVNHEG